jgi:acetyl-CoA carboxylase carboxyl transferase subunit alpha
MALLRVPIVATVVGEGGSGGALALSIGDRLLMLENAIFSVIAPEAASAILYHDGEHAHELAGQLKVTASDLVDLHLVDRVVPEQRPFHEAPDATIALLRQALVEEVGRLSRVPPSSLLKRRQAKFRHVSQAQGRLHLLVQRPRRRAEERNSAPNERSHPDEGGQPVSA